MRHDAWDTKCFKYLIMYEYIMVVHSVKLIIGRTLSQCRCS